MEKQKEKKKEALLYSNDSHLVLQGQSAPTKMDKVADRRRKVKILAPLFCVGAMLPVERAFLQQPPAL